MAENLQYGNEYEGQLHWERERSIIFHNPVPKIIFSISIKENFLPFVLYQPLLGITLIHLDIHPMFPVLHLPSIPLSGKNGSRFYNFTTPHQFPDIRIGFLTDPNNSTLFSDIILPFSKVSQGSPCGLDGTFQITSIRDDNPFIEAIIILCGNTDYLLCHTTG